MPHCKARSCGGVAMGEWRKLPYGRAARLAGPSARAFSAIKLDKGHNARCSIPCAPEKSFMSDPRMSILTELEKRVLWLASWTIHNANHVRAAGEVKVGGHQASSASLATIMTALYFSALRPQDRVAVKPHASPDLPRHPVPGGQSDQGEAGAVPIVQGRAELSLADQGRRRCRLLHRLGRPRRRPDALFIARAGLRDLARLDEGPS